jgi:hypothetical protein
MDGRARMNEAHYSEIEKTLLYISDARRRAERAAKEIRSDGAEPHLIVALDAAAADLKDLQRTQMQATYFAVSEPAPKVT